jgi:tetraacyldisaccharide 4'-kinase
MAAPPTAAERKSRLQARLVGWVQHEWEAPSLLGSLLLRPLAWLYGALATLHRLPYDWGLTTPARPPVPLVVVGNLVAGGAGKTPTVLALVRQLRALGRRPGVISRGHGRAAQDVRLVARDSRAQDVGDEPLLMHLRSGVPVAVGRDRVAAARALCAAEPTVDVLIADDGLQHLALGRDLQLLVFDDRGAGNGRLLPAGPLRQRLPRRLPPATSVLYTHGNPSTPLPGALGRRRLGGLVPLEDWWTHGPADPLAWSQLLGQRVWAAAGLARPEPFFRMLEAEGLRIERLPLSDHDPWTALPWPPEASHAVITEKDAVKLLPGRCAGTRVWVATLDFELPPDFGRQLLRQLTGAEP